MLEARAQTLSGGRPRAGRKKAANAAQLALDFAWVGASPDVVPPEAEREVADAQVADAQVADAQVADAQVADAQAADAQAADAQAADAQLADAQLADARAPLRVAAPSAPLDVPSPRARVEALERLLCEKVELGLELVITDNRRTMLSVQRTPSRTTVRLHRIFLGADERVRDALVRYLARGDAAASRALSRFIDAQSGEVRRARPRTLRPTGAHHDLAALMAELNERFFLGSIAGVCITWGRPGPRAGRRRRTIRLGTYTHEERLIRIHPALDAGWVPDFFVRFIVFHEMLHHAEPAVRHEGRMEFHTPAFRARERAYPDYTRALAWERANLRRLLSS